MNSGDSCEEDDESNWIAFEHAATAAPNADNKNLTHTVKEALLGPHASHWREAVRKEIAGLSEMRTWKLVDRPAHARLIYSKLALRINTSSEGTLLKHKARLVARGFRHQEGTDFEETFSPVAPYTAL